MRPLIGLIFLLLLAAGSLFASSQSDDDSDDDEGVTNDLSEESDEMNSECEDSALDLEEDHEAVSKQIRRCYEKLQGESWDLWSIPETYTPWIQNAGCGLEIVSADYGSVGGTGRSEQLSRIGGAEQSGTTTESNRKNVGANFSFARAHPPPPEEECRYTLQKDFIWLPANKYNTVRLRATFKATLKHESCVGDHSVQLTIRVRYLRTSYVSPTEAIALLPEHPSQQDFAGDDGEALEKFIKNAEESVHISFDTVLSTDVPTSTISVQETIPFSENLRSANLELMLITKCPEAIEVGNSQLLLFTQYSAQEDIGLSDLHLVPRALLPDNLYRRITTRLGEHIIQRTLSDDSQYVTSFQVQSESGGSIPDVTFYIIPRQKQSGDGTWRIQFGAIAYVNYQSSVKITLSCPTMVTRLHLQNVDQQHLVIQRYETMTGSYHDQHRPDENACDQVLVRITFPRRLSAPSVEKLFFICDNEPCEYKPVVATERHAGPGPVPRLPPTSTGGTGRSQTLRSPVQPGSPESEHYRRARESGRVTASGTHTSQSALHRGKYTRKLRLAIGLGVALSLSVLLICCITALIVFFRSRRVSSHPWRYASKHARKHTRTHRTSEVEEIEFLDFKPHQSQVHPLDSNKANAGIFDSVALDFTAEI